MTNSFAASRDVEAVPVFFDTVLRPHRSLPPRGFLVMMGLLFCVSVGVSLGFSLYGAWPVAGFFGADVALLYFAFRLSYRSGRQFERVVLAGDILTVEQVDARGNSRRSEFQPYWLRVILEEREGAPGRLSLASHGRELVLGAFLSAKERKDFAAALKQALQRWREDLQVESPSTSLMS